MARMTVLGAGMMGSALCVPLVDAGHEVHLVGTHLDEAIVNSLRDRGVHPTLGIELPARIHAHPLAALPEGAADADVLIVGVSSAGVRWAGEQLSRFARSGVLVAMITKGLDLSDGEIVTFPDLLESFLPAQVGARIHPIAIAGPCIAGELARRVPTCVVLTGRDRHAMDRLAGLVRTSYYHPHPSPDVVGVEASAALKNAYALALAFGAGLHERAAGQPGPVAMHNYESAIFAQAVLEMQRIVGALGGDPQTVAGLAGVGDLDVTCNGGRTGRFGRLLGGGLALNAALEQMQGVTLECRDILRVMRSAIPLLESRKRLARGQVPLLDHLAAIALDGAPVAVPFERFFRE